MSTINWVRSRDLTSPQEPAPGFGAGRQLRGLGTSTMEFSEHLATTAERIGVVKLFHLAGCLVLAVALMATAVQASAPSAWVLQPQTDYAGAPCLVTNPPGPIQLVYNPDEYAASPAYQNTVEALKLLAAAASIPSGDAFAPVGDALQINAGNKLEAARLQSVAEAAGLKALVPTRPAPAHRAKRLTGGRVPWVEVSPGPGFSWPRFFKRWGVFLAALFLPGRALWRFFFEVEADDDFANYLATLAAAHRWVFPVYLSLLMAVAALAWFQIGNLFFLLSILMLARAVRRYFCEGDFGNHPLAQKIHLGLSLLLIRLAWSLGGVDYLADPAASLGAHFWGIAGWCVLVPVTIIHRRLYNDEDFASHRAELYWFGAGFLVLAALGAIGGNRVWWQFQPGVSPWVFTGAGAILANVPLSVFFLFWIKRVDQDVSGAKLFDVLFSEGDFAEKTRRERKLPNLLLLQHWRQHGEVHKAWQTAKAHLLREPRALPVWLFALETGILYRRQPDEALKMLKDLCAAAAFDYDHRVAAVSQVQVWMAAAGFQFAPEAFKVERPLLKPSTLSGKVEAFCRDGRFGEAGQLLRAELANDSLNESAFIQLVRLYAQDLKNRPAAEQLIAAAADTFSPKTLEFLTASLDEWVRMDIRSLQPRRTLFDRLLRRPAVQPIKTKITLGPVKTDSPNPPAKDPLDLHVERLKEKQAKNQTDTSAVHDPVEKMLLERRLGSALEVLQEQAKAAPADFALWLRFAETHGKHCGQLGAAEKIIRQMEVSGNFKHSEVEKAYNQLAEWRLKHPLRQAGW